MAIAFNLPTGQSALNGFRAFARMDPDIVGLATFGEGFNVGPVIGTTVTVNSDFVVAASIGYNARGSYWRDNLINPATGGPPPGVSLTGLSALSPGDITTVTGNFAYRWNSFTLRGNASYSWEAQTNVNGGAFYKTGDRFAVAGSITYDWDNSWYTVLSGNWSHNNRNQVLNTAFVFSPLVLEMFDSNVNVFQTSLDHRFKLGDWSYGPTVSYLYRDRNGWDPTVIQFVPAKTRWGAGGGAEYAWNKQLTLRGRFEYIWIDQEAQPDIAVPSVTLSGIMLSGGLTCTF